MNYKHNPKLTVNARELRKNITAEERHLWYDFLRDFPVRFLRQKVIDNYIVDFYCAAAKIVVELDGSHHCNEHYLEYDLKRTLDLKQHGLTVIRISNADVNQNFDGVCEFITLRVSEVLGKSVF